MQSKMDNQAKNRDGNTPPPNTITFTPNSEDPIGTQTQTEGVIVEPTPQPTNPTPCDLPPGACTKTQYRTELLSRNFELISRNEISSY